MRYPIHDLFFFFTCKSMVFTNKSLLCNWESYLVSQLYWLKGPYNRFQTHKRFKRFEVYKSDALVLLFWKQNRWLSANQITFPPGRENNLIGQSDYFPSWRENDLIGCSFCVSTHMILITNSHWLLKWLHRMMKFHCERGYKYPCFFNKLIHYLLIFLCVNNLFQNLRILGLVNFHRIFLQ